MTSAGQILRVEPERLPMKVSVLTTETPHHLYFLRHLRRRCPGLIRLDLVLVETRPFPYGRLFWKHARARWYNPVSAVPFNPYWRISYAAREQRRYEMEHFFPDGTYGYDSDLRVEKVRSVNGEQARRSLAEVAPDVVLVYGTGLVRSHILGVARTASINCHGGWLPEYRGSDTNLWAAFRGEFHKMALAWHVMDSSFDTGPILMMERVEPKTDMSAVTLRYQTAVLATDMCVRLLNQLAGPGIEARPQASDGRYYRPMPWLLKPIANWRLRRFAKRNRAGSES